MSRCRVAIKYGTTLTTRCFLHETGHKEHRGKGLAEFPYQEIVWLEGDRRTFLSDRTDEHAWELPFSTPNPQPDHSVIWRDHRGRIVEGPHDEPDRRPN